MEWRDYWYTFGFSIDSKFLKTCSRVEKNGPVGKYAGFAFVVHNIPTFCIYSSIIAYTKTTTVKNMEVVNHKNDEGAQQQDG